MKKYSKSFLFLLILIFLVCISCGCTGAAGQQGQTGPSGAGISGARVDGSGHLVLTLTDGRTLDAGIASGSGTIIDNRGYIVTNNHGAIYRHYVFYEYCQRCCVYIQWWSSDPVQ